MPKKVLYVITKQDVGGAQKYVHDLAAHLDPNRFEAKVFYGGTDIRWLSNDVRWWLLFANDFLAVAELVAVFRRERPDVIHLNSSKAGVIGSLAAGMYKLFLRLNPKPYTLYPRIVFTAHGWVFNPTNYYSPLMRTAYALFHRFAARFQDTIVNVSEHDRGLALRFRIAPAHKLVTIHNGIDPNIPFLNRAEARNAILKKLIHRPTDQLINSRWVGSVGRLTREKNYETLIAAAAQTPNALFFIIGNGPEQRKLQLLITNYQLQNKFFIVPPTGNDAVFLKAFDVFVLPSIKEGLPYTLLEAKAADLPCVVTDAGGIQEVADPPRDAVVSRKNSAALATTIMHIFKTKSPPAHRRTDRFTLQAMVRATEKVY